MERSLLFWLLQMGLLATLIPSRVLSFSSMFEAHIAQGKGRFPALASSPDARGQDEGTTPLEEASPTTELSAQEQFALKMGKNASQKTSVELAKEAELEKRQRMFTAAGSALAAISLFTFQKLNPPEPLQLLRTMSRESTTLQAALANGRPTVVDFYADWCDNCIAMAPTMRKIEKEYQGQVNFVVVDGGDSKNYDLVGKFHVDGIPHVAFINKQGEVETALIGMVPKPILEDEIDSLLAGRPVPWVGFDAFRGQSHKVSDL